MEKTKTYELIEALDELETPFETPPGFRFQGQLDKVIVVTCLLDVPVTTMEQLQEAFPDDYTVLVFQGAFGLKFMKLKETDAYPEDTSGERTSLQEG